MYEKYCEIRDKKGLRDADVAKGAGITKSTFSDWKSGRSKPKNDKLQKIANFLGVTVEYLMNDEKENERSELNPTTVNVYGKVAAGIPLEMITDIIDTEEISPQLAKAGTYFGLQIHGSSMEPRICEGDTVIVRQQNDAESGEIVIATVNGTDATCKRLKKYTEGIALLSNNPACEPMFFSNKEIEEKPVRILGKVVELRGKF